MTMIYSSQDGKSALRKTFFGEDSNSIVHIIAQENVSLCLGKSISQFDLLCKRSDGVHRKARAEHPEIRCLFPNTNNSSVQKAITDPALYSFP